MREMQRRLDFRLTSPACRFHRCVTMRFGMLEVLDSRRLRRREIRIGDGLRIWRPAFSCRMMRSDLRRRCPQERSTLSPRRRIPARFLTDLGARG